MATKKEMGKAKKYFLIISFFLVLVIIMIVAVKITFPGEVDKLTDKISEKLDKNETINIENVEITNVDGKSAFNFWTWFTIATICAFILGAISYWSFKVTPRELDWKKVVLEAVAIINYDFGRYSFKWEAYELKLMEYRSYFYGGNINYPRASLFFVPKKMFDDMNESNKSIPENAYIMIDLSTKFPKRGPVGPKNITPERWDEQLHKIRFGRTGEQLEAVKMERQLLPGQDEKIIEAYQDIQRDATKKIFDSV